MNKSIKYLLFVGIYLTIGSIQAGLTVGVQIVSYVDNGTVSLKTPSSSIPTGFKCLYNSEWQDSNGNNIQLYIDPATNGPVTSEWVYIEFDESVTSKDCTWNKHYTPQFTSPIEVYEEPFANLTFAVDGTVSCSDSNKGANCKLVSWLPVTCPNDPIDSTCYQILVGTTPNTYCITNINMYDTASAMCVTTQSGNSISVNPKGDTQCYQTEPSITNDTLTIAAYNWSDCSGDSSCNVYCNIVPSLSTPINANTTISVGCQNEPCKLADSIGGTPGYEVVSTTQNTNANKEAPRAQTRKPKFRPEERLTKEDEQPLEEPRAQIKPEKRDLIREEELKKTS